MVVCACMCHLNNSRISTGLMHPTSNHLLSSIPYLCPVVLFKETLCRPNTERNCPYVACACRCDGGIVVVGRVSGDLGLLLTIPLSILGKGDPTFRALKGFLRWWGCVSCAQYLYACIVPSYPSVYRHMVDVWLTGGSSQCGMRQHPRHIDPEGDVTRSCR